MALDLIKEYLVGIGFKVNEDSFNNASNSIKNTEDTIKKFNDNSNKGFSETSDSLGSLFKLFASSYGTLGKLSPGMKTPFAGLVNDIILLKKLYAEFQSELRNSKKPDFDVDQVKEEFKSKNTKTYTPKAEETETKELSIIPKKTELPQVNNLVETILNAKEVSKSLASEGGSAIRLFSSGAVAEFAVVAVGVVALIAGISKLISSIANLAKQDIEYEKLSRQLWTTKENAKEVDMAMKTLGVSMQDLWLSPTLLKQFNQLRQDSANLKLPKEYTDNLKVVQDLGLEFSRLRQLGQLAFQWIGNYILKYAAGPLNEFRQGLHEFNDWLIKNIPKIGKIVGTVLGVILRILIILGEAIGGIITIISKIVGAVKGLFDMLPAPIKNIIKLIAAIGLIIMTGPVGAVIALIAVLDDLFTYLKGGKSLIGSFFDNLFGKNDKKQTSNIANAANKVQQYNKNNSSSVPKNYTTNNTTTHSNSKTNSDNTIHNDNKIYVYGSGDPNSTANAVQNKFAGLQTRNLQGVVK
ncbi:hypothetical protein [Clostridium sp.]|uniref:hypothetical protein n=1 Tax=Clostridium sp. TaxID=1506 RepID=UPI0026077BA6|nr:hypothetical protein [Clostridium sp.]